MTSIEIPATMKQITVKKLGSNFREVTELEEVPVPKPGPKQALVRTSYVSINAADILYTDGFYTPGMQPPFPAGLEAMGEVVALGEGSRLRVGQHVFFPKLGVFSDYNLVDDHIVTPLESSDPIIMCIAGSGTTASVSLEKKANLKEGENVLITAAAGATGQFAVQLAKLAGCHVIGTCSTEVKAEFLKSIGCDRTIVYTKECLDEVLTKEYPNGIDVVYEGIGNEVFDTCMKHLSLFGRILVIGAISAYDKEGTIKKTTTSLPVCSLALRKSADIRGFFLTHYPSDIHVHTAKLQKMIASGQIKVILDNGEKSEKGPFIGIEKVYDAIDHMYTKKNIGKTIVALHPGTSSP